MSQREIELKLAFDPRQRQRLARLPAVTELADGEGITENLVSTYYDTPERILARHGAAWRIRHGGSEPVQTIKIAHAPGGGTFQHDEVETPVNGDGPEPERLGRQAARRLPEAFDPTQLTPVFTTRFRRRKRPLATAEGDRIEMAVDEGTIAPHGDTGDGFGLAELELELQAGREAALYELARRINESVPLAPVGETKAARGYALADGAAVPAGVKASAVKLPADATAETAFATILGQCLDHIAANERAAADGRDPEGVHQMRVGLRRLRAAFDLFAPILPASASEHNARLKAIADALGPARDWDVFLTELLPPVRDGVGGDPALDDLAARAQEARRAAYEEVRAVLGDGRYTQAMLGLRQWLAEAGWRSGDNAAALAWPARTAAASWLEERYRKVYKRGKKLAQADTRQRHKLRIQGKKLRYAGMFFASLYKKKKTRPFLKALADLQDELGHLNDIATARERLAALDDGGPEHARAAALIEGWYSRVVAERESDLQRTWDALAKRARFWPKPGRYNE